MNLKNTITLAFVAAFLSGCGSTPDQQPDQAKQQEQPPSGYTEVGGPSWFDPSLTADAEGHVYGYGMGRSESRRLAQMSAKAEARRELAASMSTQATALLEETAQDMGSGASETARGAFENFFSQRVHGSRPDRNGLYRDNKTDEYIAFYRMRVKADLFDRMLQSSIESASVNAAAEESGHEDAIELLRQRRAEENTGREIGAYVIPAGQSEPIPIEP